MPVTRKKRILNVDDNDAGRYGVTKTLKKAGFLVIEAVNGRDALQKVAEEHPDLVLLDVNMPDISGFEVCKQLKKDPGTASIPVVHLSATAILPGDRVHGLEGGADGYLVEPVDPDELVATIGSFLRIREATEEALRESAERLKFAFEGTNDGIWDMQMDTGAVYISPRGGEILGYAPDELSRIAQTWSQLVHPDDQPATTTALNEYLCGRAPIFDVEQRLKTKSGDWKWIRTRGKAISRDKNGAPMRMVGTYTDITDRKLAEVNLRHVTRLYALLSQINQSILRTREQDELFRTICKVAIEYGQFRMAWVGLIDEADDRIKPVAHAGHEDGYLDQILITSGDTPTGKGPTGSAFREGKIMTSNDIATESWMLPWREEALKRGYRSSAAVPFKRKGKPVGTLNLYATEPGFFTANEQRLLQEIGWDISFALDAMTLETERKQVEDMLKSALEEKEFLLREIHHRVKSNLQLITTLIRFQKERIKDASTISALEDSESRIRSMALVHENLYHSIDLASIDFSDYIRTLTNKLITTYAMDPTQIHLNIDIKNVLLDIERAIPMGLIMNELIANALKHAFPDGRSEEITIIGRRTPAGITLSVQDNGVGMPDGLDWRNTPTLGLHLVINLIRQVKGSIKLNRTGGTAFEMTIPLAWEETT